MAGYGYDRVTTPELDRLAADGIEFRNSFAAAPWTLPSHASLFTGLYPVSHAATQENLFLDDSLVTMAEIMRDGGYRTFGATNNAVIAGNSNFDQGFETYLQMSQRGRKVQKPKLGAHPTNLAALEFLDSVEEHERFFVFLNFIEAHSPYKPRREMAERFLEPEWSRRLMKWAASQGWDRHYMEGNTLSEEENEVLRSLYDAELAGLSRTIQELIDVIEERGLGPETVVVVTSDHGENIGDHGHMGHVFDLHDTLLRVPLFFYGGGLPRGVKRSDPATSVDLFHTILALAGFGEKAEAGQGRDLLAGDADEVEDLALMAEYYYPLQVLSVLDQRGRGYKTRFERLSPYLRRMRSVRIGDWKLIWGTDGHHSLYNLAEDPGESVDLSAQNPSRVRELEGVLLHRLRRLTGRDLEAVAKPYTGPTQPRGFENLDEETREQLKALGYLD
jgi:arylsulfatase A-like enzyme